MVARLLCRAQFQSTKFLPLLQPCGHEKLQLIHRLPAPLYRHRWGDLPAAAAAREQGLSRARFYKLYSHYLPAGPQGQAEICSPGLSGGDHHPAWPDNVSALLTKLPSSYSATASELHPPPLPP